MSIISNAINFSPLGDNRLMPLEGWKQPSQNSYPGPGTLLEAWNNCHLNFDFHNLVEQVIRNSKFELWCWKRLLNCKEIQPVHPKGNQSWIFIGRTDAEAETPMLWPADVKNWLIGKDPDAGKDWRLEEKGTTEDEMVGWSTTDLVDSMDMSMSKLQQRIKDGEAWWAAVRGCKESDTSQWLNNDNNEFQWLVRSHGVSDRARLTSTVIQYFDENIWEARVFYDCTGNGRGKRDTFVWICWKSTSRATVLDFSFQFRNEEPKTQK